MLHAAMAISPEFIRSIPKTDLHLHLDGSLRLPTLIELAQKENVEIPSYTEEGLKKRVFKEKYRNLEEYLRGFVFTCAVLRNPENIERVSFELAEDNLAEGVRYIEVRLAPQLLVQEGMSAADVLGAMAKGLQTAQKRHNSSSKVKEGLDLPFQFGIIVCAMRAFNTHMGPYFKNLLGVLSHAPAKEVVSTASLELVREAIRLRDELGLPVVGFDLAGEEAGYPAADHVEAFQHAHQHFLGKTVHAGEAYGPESIFQAIGDCHADRIGHGTFLFAQDKVQDPAISDPKKFVQSLAEYVASRRVTVEVCLTSNLQTTPEISRPKAHPLAKMFEHNLSVSICTDNRLVSNTSVSQELELVIENFSVSERQLRNLIIAGFKGSFFPGSYNEKRTYVRQAIDQYDRLRSEFGLLKSARKATSDKTVEAH